jgi:zinc transport system substrate-binding protein
VRSKLAPALAASLLILLPACSSRAPEPPVAGRKPLVYTTNYPLEYFAARLAGELAEVRFPAPPEADPAYWEPAPEIIQAYQSADLILLNGAGYEKWTERASLPLARLIDTSAAFASDYIPLREVVTHSHGPAGQHTHAGFAFTTWLDPQLARRQAEAIRDALVRLLPERQAMLGQRFVALAADLAALDAELAQATAGGAPLLASHPVYQYLERRYRLNLVSLHWEPNEMPSETEWRRLEGVLRTHGARAMLWEAEPSGEIAARLAKHGIAPVVFDPCANRPRDGDYLAVMRANAARLRAALGGQARR